MEARLVLVTHPEGEEAVTLARALVEEGAAACVNIVPGITSVYRWQGRIESDREALLVIKTCSGRLAELEKRVISLHPYDTPEFVVIDPSAVNERYLAWLTAAVERR